MNGRLIAKAVMSVLLVAGAAGLAVVAIALSGASGRENVAAGAAFLGVAPPAEGGLSGAGVNWSGRTAEVAYLRALAAERAAAKIDPSKHQGQSDSAFAHADIAARAALALDQTPARRSQLLTLLAVDELGEANADVGNETQFHNRAAWNLQLAVLTDPSNDDAKYDLELLMLQDPQSTKKQPKNSKPSGANHHKHSPGKSHSKGNRGADMSLGGGY